MVNLKIKFFGIIFFFLIFLLVVFLSWGSRPKTQPLSSAVPNQAVEKTIEETIQYGKIKAAYPLFANADANRETAYK